MSALDSFRIDSKVALVTGGGRGLGAAMAQALADGGARVVVVGRTEAPLVETVARISDSGAEIRHRVVDVSVEHEVAELFAWIDQEFGGADVVVNNAAVADEAAVSDATVADWERVMQINVRGAFLTAREIARRESDTPRSIINIASLAGTVGVKNQAAYSASKGAVASLTRALAVELAPKAIRVNAIAPGYFSTDMPAEVLRHERARDALLRRIPQRRVPDPAEIGPTALYLASDASAFMTGSIIHLDGGYTAQ